MFEAEKSAKKGQLLPDGVEFTDLERAWEIWQILRKIDWRWPPNVIEAQPDALMQDVATLEWYSSVLKDSLVGAVGTIHVPVQG